MYLKYRNYKLHSANVSPFLIHYKAILCRLAAAVSILQENGVCSSVDAFKVLNKNNSVIMDPNNFLIPVTVIQIYYWQPIKLEGKFSCFH